MTTATAETVEAGRNAPTGTNICAYSTYDLLCYFTQDHI